MENQNQLLYKNGPWYFREFTVEDQIAVGKKYLGRKASDKEAFDFFQYYFCMPECINLGNLSIALKISGGVPTMEGLLRATGFLTGAHRSLCPLLPYSRFIQRDYFIIRNEAHPRSVYKRLTIHITRKGVKPVLNKLRQFGLQIPDQVEEQIIHNMDLAEWNTDHGPRFI
jgi:hypothetical protein